MCAHPFHVHLTCPCAWHASHPAELCIQSKYFGVGFLWLPRVSPPQLPLVSGVWLCAFASASCLECLPGIPPHLTWGWRADSSQVEVPRDEVTVPPGDEKLPSRAPHRTKQKPVLPLLLKFYRRTPTRPPHPQPLPWPPSSSGPLRRPLPGNLSGLCCHHQKNQLQPQAWGKGCLVWVWWEGGDPA